MFLNKSLSSQSREHFPKFQDNIFVIILRDIVVLEKVHNFCLSAIHNPEYYWVICTDVTLFALVLHLNCTALSQSESSNFFMYLIKLVIKFKLN